MCCFTPAMLLVNLAAPPKDLGSVNGVGQTVSSLVRAMGPALGGVLWAFSLVRSLCPTFDAAVLQSG